MATSARLDELKKKFDENPRRYFAPLANEYRKLGDLTQAIALCRAHLPNQPGHISGHIVLAQALYEARELGESRQIFEASLDLDPENLIALRFLGDIAREQGEPMQARGWYERVLDADPRNEDIAQLLKELDGASVATADEDESRVPALEDLPQPPLTGFEPPSFRTAETFEGTVSGSHPIDPLVASTESETPAWGNPASTPPAGEFVAHADALHDLPADGATLSFFEETTTEDVFAASSEVADEADPFFGAADDAGSLDENELLESVDSAEDDWFARASAAPEHEGIEGIPTGESSHFEDSFLPDLSQVTPINSQIVDEGSDPEAAPVYVDEQADRYEVDASASALGETPAPRPTPSQSSIPTPSFLNAVSDEEPAELSAFESDLDVAQTEAFIASAPTPALAPFAIDFDPYTTDSADSSDTRASEVDEFDDEPTIGSISHSDTELEPVESVSDEFSDEFSDVSERDARTREIKLTSQFADLPDVVSDVVSDVASEDSAFGVDASDEFATAAQAPESLVANFDDIERDEPQTEPSAIEAASPPESDFVLEYGEFVAPESDGTPFIATTVSVPLAGEDSVYETPAIVPTDFAASLDASNESPIEPPIESSMELAIESTGESWSESALDASSDETAEVTSEYDEAEPESEPLELEPASAQFEDRDAPIVSEQRESWRDAEIAPIEGLISREVAAVPEEEFNVSSDAEVEQQESPAFVTETMAELYLQQGFSDEALAIYRQLLAQQPDDVALQDRIAAIERGASSTVVDGISPRDTIDRAGQSVRHFFSHFARRTPRPSGAPAQGDDAQGHARAAFDSPAGEPEGRTAGAANRDEALTVPDEGAPPATLSQLFASGVVSGADENAATSLSSAYSAEDSAPASRIAERELSLEHLFRDVPARSSGAVTLDEFYQGSSSGDSDPADRDAADGEERGADIEQFTAWLEGLKKK